MESLRETVFWKKEKRGKKKEKRGKKLEDGLLGWIKPDRFWKPDRLGLVILEKKRMEKEE